MKPVRNALLPRCFPAFERRASTIFDGGAAAVDMVAHVHKRSTAPEGEHVA